MLCKLKYPPYLFPFGRRDYSLLSKFKCYNKQSLLPNSNKAQSNVNIFTRFKKIQNESPIFLKSSFPFSNSFSHSWRKVSENSCNLLHKQIVLPSPPNSWNTLNPGFLGHEENRIISSPKRNMSFRTRKAAAKVLSRKKVQNYKHKTHKGFHKRITICGLFSDRRFKHKAVGYRHLMRNKSPNALKKKRRPRFIVKYGILQRAKKLLPYYKRKKYLR